MVGQDSFVACPDSLWACLDSFAVRLDSFEETPDSLLANLDSSGIGHGRVGAFLYTSLVGDDSPCTAWCVMVVECGADGVESTHHHHAGQDTLLVRMVRCSASYLCWRTVGAAQDNPGGRRGVLVDRPRHQAGQWLLLPLLCCQHSLQNMLLGHLHLLVAFAKIFSWSY